MSVQQCKDLEIEEFSCDKEEFDQRSEADKEDVDLLNISLIVVTMNLQAMADSGRNM